MKKSNTLMMKILSSVENVKKVTFSKMEERESSLSLLVQKGTLDEIRDYFTQHPTSTYNSHPNHFDHRVFSNSG